MHILLTSLGTTARETRYQLHGRTATGSLTPLALVKLLECKPDQVIAVVTAAAKKKTWPDFKREMGIILGFPPQPLAIPEGRNRQEISQILERVASIVPQGTILTLDITQGLRHIPFFFYAVALYLTSLRNVAIRGAYYGMFEASEDPKPIIDLQPLLELPQWFHAVRVFQDQGATLPMARLIQPLSETIKARARQEPLDSVAAHGLYRQAGQVERVGTLLAEHAFAYEAALPMELGRISHLLVQPVRDMAAMEWEELPPLGRELTEVVAGVAESRSLVQPPSRKGKWKQGIALDDTELTRQAHMIDFYLELNQLPLAIGLMREWVVSWSMWRSDLSLNWYDLRDRERYECILSTLGEQARNDRPRISPAQQCFGDFWNQVTDLRNAIHHHGMREDEVVLPPKELPSIENYWRQLTADKIDWHEILSN